jgi:plasmid maintenance system antidote protein VapI
VPKRESIDIKRRLRIAGHVRNKLKELGITQVQAAKMMGVDQGTVSRLVNATESLGLDLFIRIHRGLGIDANRLLDVEPEIKPRG